MGEATQNYIRSAEGFKDFFEMLYDAMLSSLEQAQISKTGGFWWREYRIDRYQSLARAQYYCGLCWWSGEDPQVLVFSEIYLHNGRYHFPFREKLDLVEKGFFDLDVSEQKAFLVEFISEASRKALEWQRSPERAREVPPELLNGKKTQPNPKEGVKRYAKVPESFSMVLKLQDSLFRVLRRALRKVIPPERLELRENRHWRNWDFRGSLVSANLGRQWASDVAQSTTLVRKRC